MKYIYLCMYIVIISSLITLYQNTITYPETFAFGGIYVYLSLSPHTILIHVSIKMHRHQGTDTKVNLPLSLRFLKSFDDPFQTGGVSESI